MYGILGRRFFYVNSVINGCAPEQGWIMVIGRWKAWFCDPCICLFNVYIISIFITQQTSWMHTVHRDPEHLENSTKIFHCSTSEWVSKRAKEWSARAKRAVRSKRTSGRCERASKRWVSGPVLTSRFLDDFNNCACVLLWKTKKVGKLCGDFFSLSNNSGEKTVCGWKIMPFVVFGILGWCQRFVKLCQKFWLKTT